MNGEDELAMVSRHVREGEAHIARQAEIVAKFSAAGHDTDMAETLLAQFRSIQALHCAHLARLLARATDCPILIVDWAPTAEVWP